MLTEPARRRADHDSGVASFAARAGAGAQQAPVSHGSLVDAQVGRYAARARRRRSPPTAPRGLRDLSRTGFIVSGGEVFLLEANVPPGLTETSTLPMALEAAGRSLGTVCRDLLGQAAARGT